MRNPSFLQLKRGLELPFQLIRTSSSHTGTLPRFPVPILGKTLDRYLKSAKPFLSSEERCKSEDIIKKFGEPGGVGDKLQEKLLERAQKCDNWLEEWWVNVAYLEYRDPVVVFSNPGLVFPPRKFNNLEEQLDTAAKLTVAALSYKKLIDDGEIPLETSGKSPLDMDQYHKVFGTIRQPWKPRDKLLFYPKSEHIVVAYKKNFFKIRVIQSGQIVKSSEILAALKKIVTDGNEGPGVGILTSDSRDNWSETYAALKKDPVNANSIKEIEESIFLLCLDGDVPSGHQTITDAIAANLVHGGSSQHNSSNRWFDKTIQFVVGSRTGWGLNYEHSPAEGQAIARLMDHIVEQMECDLDSGTCLNQEPIKLSFSLTDELRCAVERASENLSKITNDLEFNCIKFSDFGKNAIKKLRVSPDSFIQMAMQYAFYRVHQTPAAHYETGSTRMFKGGRTETIRSCSEESVAFARAMLNNRVPDLFKAKALLAAINAHKEYTVMAMSAQGVDRHFLGLRKIAAQENQTEGLEIFEDVAWKRSTHMRISSSQVAGKSEGFMIYGPLVHDGYACCYNPRDDDILFGTSAWRSNSETKLLCFGQTLQEALREMRQLLENNPLAKL